MGFVEHPTNGTSKVSTFLFYTELLIFCIKENSNLTFYYLRCY